MASILIKNGNIVHIGAEAEGVFKADILVRDSRIVKVGRINPSDLKKGKKPKVINGSGKFITPGFIQSHVHLCQTLFRGQAEDLELLDWLQKKIWPLEASHTPKSLRQSARIGLSELIQGGTTTVVDMGTSHHTEQLFEAAREAGVRAFIGNAMMDSGKTLPPELKEKTGDIVSKSIKLIERYHKKDDGMLNYILSPRFILTSSDDLFKEVRELSKAYDLLIQTHACENPKETQAVKALKGKNEIGYFNSIGILNKNLILAHCVWLEDKDFELLSEAKANVAHCPSTNLKLGSGIAKVPELLNSEVNVTLGSDGAPCNNSLNMFNEMKLSGLLQKFRKGLKALPAKMILEMATINGARAIRMEKELGTVEEGKLADIVILDLDKPNSLPAIEDIYTRIVYSANPSNIDAVIINGEIRHSSS